MHRLAYAVCIAAILLLPGNALAQRGFTQHRDWVEIRQYDPITDELAMEGARFTRTHFAFVVGCQEGLKMSIVMNRPIVDSVDVVVRVDRETPRNLGRLPVNRRALTDMKMIHVPSQWHSHLIRGGRRGHTLTIRLTDVRDGEPTNRNLDLAVSLAGFTAATRNMSCLSSI
jgi:hypothetical protein